MYKFHNWQTEVGIFPNVVNALQSTGSSMRVLSCGTSEVSAPISGKRSASAIKVPWFMLCL